MSKEFDSLLTEISSHYRQAVNKALLAERSEHFSDINTAGPRIREERNKQHLTLNELCELSGVSYATLSKIEQGHSRVRLDNLISVAQALGLNLWIG